ncbi:MAG: hypothetical protein JSV23_05695 [Promethearchaeota archaeon]|nr:MAG: hypothetical protein JSV23_05695 [Candidatus Lokiarchaeota archaeon]
MEKVKFKQAFKIDDKRLLWNYNRITRMFKNSDHVEIIAKFLINQSIGFSLNRILDILNYYKPIISKNKTLLDFAFEWVRANKIRFEYKKFINLGTYEDPNSAIDDTIFLFFLDYDKYIREFFIKNISEIEICALYEIFFNPNQVDSTNMNFFLKKNELRVHTIIKENEKVDTNIFTLREGLSSMIKKDYNELHPSKVQIKSEQQKNDIKVLSTITKFDGTMLERLIKSYCFNKQKIVEKELENSISSFLSSFLKFGQIYKYKDFKEKLIRNLTDSLYSGLPENYKFDSLDILISDILVNFERTLKNQKLDGLAWIKDLNPILKDIVIKFIDTL